MSAAVRMLPPPAAALANATRADALLSASQLGETSCESSERSDVAPTAALVAVAAAMRRRCGEGAGDAMQLAARLGWWCGAGGPLSATEGDGRGGGGCAASAVTAADDEVGGGGGLDCDGC